MRGTTKLAAVAVSTVALALSAAGCKGEAGPSAAPENKPASVLEMMVSDVTGSIQKVADRTTKSKSMKVKMDASLAGTTATAEGVLSYGKPLMAELEMTTPTTGTVTVRLIGTVEYVQIPAAQRGSMNGKKWMKIDIGSLTKQAGAADMMKQFEDMDPGKQVKLLLAGGTIKAVGEEQVDGVKTVHYAGTAPIGKYLEQLNVKLQSEVKKELAKQGAKEISIDLWVDENYQPLRVKSVMGKSNTDVRYSDFGTRVSVVAPPAGETVDLAEMLKGLKAPN